MIKIKFSTLWVSVRKAFLDLDSNKDGQVEVSDFMRYFGDHDDIDPVDMQKLIQDKSRSSDLNKNAINCSDFTHWLGESIHQREGFYFRHDSIKNPKFDLFLKKRDEQQKDNQVAVKTDINTIF